MNTCSGSLRLIVVLLPLALAASMPPVRAADLPPPNYPTPYYFTTFAGDGTRGSVNGVGTAASFHDPSALAFGPDGALYVADGASHAIRKITPTGAVSTFAGSPGDVGIADGPAPLACFNNPRGIVVDASGNVFVADTLNHTIRRISTSGAVTTYAGRAEETGTTNATSTSARFSYPRGLGIDAAGNLYVSELGAHRIRKITPGRVVTTLAGGTSPGFLDGVGTAARFNAPLGIAVTANGTVYVADTLNDVIRVVSPAGVVVTLAGKAGENASTDGPGIDARFDDPTGVALDRSGNLYVTDALNDLIRKITPQGAVTTLAGLARERGIADGLGDAARFNRPSGIAIDARGNVFVADNDSFTIRRSAFAPTFTRQPAGVSAAAGAPTRISAEVQSEPGPTRYRWLKNGATHSEVLLPESSFAGNVSLTFASVQPADAGTYTLVVHNIAGGTTSTGAVLTVSPPPPVVTAPTITRQPAHVTANVGEPISLGVSGTGTAPLTVQWFKNGTAIGGANEPALTIARAREADAGNYHVVLRNSAGTATSTIARVTVRAATPPPARGDETVVPPPPTVEPATPVVRLSNLSIRTSLATGQNVIVGLAVAGGTRDILVRAVGPGLQTFGLAGAMSDPRLELFRGVGLIHANDNWPVELAPAFAPVGAFALPVGSRDAALRQTLEGALSIQAQGSGPGVVLLEAYDLGDAGSARLVNVSARNRVGSGDDVLIAGFTLAGSGTKRLLIRAVGPALAEFGVAGTLADPVLELYAGTNKVAENDDWSAELAPHFAAVGAFSLPLRSRDAALVVTLPVGAYTTLVRGVNGATGEALVEIYELP